MSKTDLIRREISLAPLTEEEIELIAKRRMEARYDNIVEKINKIIPVNPKIKEYYYDDSIWVNRPTHIRDILNALPSNVLESLERILND